MMKFIDERDLLDPFQSGFRRNFSTHTALIRLVDDCREAIDADKVVLLISVDFSRAFDVVCTDVLIDKLINLGFSDKASNWIRSYLTARSQKVSLPNGQLSDNRVRSSGVPQGSILGPLLFLLFINDLPNVLEYCKYHIYADDLVIYCAGPFSDNAAVVQRANHDLQRVSWWGRDNGIAINCGKTKAMWLGSRGFMSRLGCLNSPSLVLNGDTIETSNVLKVLGVTLDSTLSWRPFCNDIAKKVYASLAKLRKNRNFLLRSSKLLLVKALIWPHLDYCAGICLDLSKELTLKLSRCCNAAIRFVTNTPLYEHITPAYIELKVLTFSLRRNFVIANLLVAILKTGRPNYIAKNLHFRPCGAVGSSRVSPLDLQIRNFRLTTFKSSFSIGAAYLWNELPESVRTLYKLGSFKSKLFTYLLERVACKG